MDDAQDEGFRSTQRFRQYEAWMSSFAGLLAAQHGVQSVS
jgi:hypothetical protein